MTHTEITAKIAHYEYMLENMTLNPAHEFFIRDLLDDLKEEVTK